MKQDSRQDDGTIRRFPVPPKPVPGHDGPDSGIVVRLGKGEAGALQELMDQYWSALVAYAGRIAPGSSDPQDLVQTTFLRLWNRRGQLKAHGSLRALLYTMVRNVSLDEIRKTSRRASAEAHTSPPSPSPTPYEDVQGAEIQRAAAAAVGRLPTKRQEVFRLVREEGLSYQEVAEVMDLSRQTVANHMSLALADLRVALKPFLRHPLEDETRGVDSLKDG